MKAIVYRRYGKPEVLRLTEVAIPEPGENDILVRVKAVAVNSGDCRLRRADPFAVRFFFGLFRPRKAVLGAMFSGEVVRTGKNVTRFRAGDEVFGSSGMAFGAYAEYLCLPGTAVMALKPAGLSHEDAAALPFGGLTALHFLQKAGITKGQQVLVYGASGAVGTAVLQLAVQAGARVTAVCSTANAELVRSLGAAQVIDYTKETPAQTGCYDLVIDTVNKLPFAQAIALVKEGGMLLLSAAVGKEMLRAGLAGGKKKVLTGIIRETQANLDQLSVLAAAGKYKAVIGKKFRLEEMAAAHAYVETGHKQGNAVAAVA